MRADEAGAALTRPATAKTIEAGSCFMIFSLLRMRRCVGRERPSLHVTNGNYCWRFNVWNWNGAVRTGIWGRVTRSERTSLVAEQA